MAAGQPLVAASAMDEVVAVAAVDAGPSGRVGAELVMAGTTHNALAGSQPDDEVHSTAYPRQAGLRGSGHLRVTTKSRGGIEPYQPGREGVPARSRPRTRKNRRDGRPRTHRRRQRPNQGPCPARKSNREHPRLQSSNCTDPRPRQTQTSRPGDTAATDRADANRQPMPQQTAHRTDAGTRRKLVHPVPHRQHGPNTQARRVAARVAGTDG